MTKKRPNPTSLIMKSLYFVFCFLLCHVATAQFTESEVVTFLTANANKLWFLDRYKIIMGGSDTCEKGEAYVFFAENKTVEHKKCVEGAWVKKQYTWTLEKESPFDWWILFNDKKYYLSKTDFPSYELLKLREINPYSKGEVTIDIELKFYKDE